MTAFARKVLSGLPDPTRAARRTTTTSCRTSRTTTTSGSGKVDYQYSTSLSFFGRFGYRKVDNLDDPPLPLPSGGAGNASTYAKNKQFAAGLHLGALGHVAPRRPLRLVATPRPARTRGASARRRRSRAYGITGLPTDPRITGGLLHAAHHRLLGPRPPGDEPAVAVPGDVQREAELHLDRGPALAQDRLRVPVRHRPRCRTSTRSTAATPTRAVHAADRRGREQPLQPGRLHVRPPQPVRAEQHPHREHAPAIPVRVPAGRLARERQADAERRPALRVRDAAVGEGQHAVELRPGDQDDDHGQGRVAVRPRARQSRPQQLRPAPRVRLQHDAEDRPARRLGPQLHPLPPRSAPPTCCRSTDRRSSTRSSPSPTRRSRRSARRSRATRRASPIRRSSTR